MPSEISTSSNGVNHAGSPIRLLEQEAHIWTALELRVILRHNGVAFNSKSPKVDLVQRLKQLIKARQQQGLQLTEGERDPILRSKEVHQKPDFNPRLAALATYAVKTVSSQYHEFEDFRNVDRICHTPVKPTRRTYLRYESKRKIFEELLFRYCISYRQIPASSWDDDVFFATLVKEKPIIKSCTDQTIKYNIQKYVQSFRRENDIPIARDVEEELKERKSAAAYKTTSSMECGHKLTTILKRVRFVDDPVEEEWPAKRKETSMLCPDPSIHEQDFDRPISPTPPQGYTTTKKIRCPNCSKMDDVTKERYHKPTSCLHCRHEYCWECRAAWKDIKAKGSSRHLKRCPRYRDPITGL